jgi:hypothetical protein
VSCGAAWCSGHTWKLFGASTCPWTTGLHKAILCYRITLLLRLWH